MSISQLASKLASNEYAEDYTSSAFQIPCVSDAFFVVEPSGLEPLTFRLQGGRSPS